MGLLFFIFIISGLVVLARTKTRKNTKPSTIPVKIDLKKKSLIFVPYWEDFTNLNKENKKYDRYIYFGSGENMSSFIKITADKEKWLTVIMTNTDVNLEILKNKKSWQKIINDAIITTEENKFNGIVLDFEMSVLPFENVVLDINDFVKEFCSKVHERKIKLALTVYGDTFYRKRPYDLKTLNNCVDEFMIMAYDFHKSRGEAGPNFPFARRSFGEEGVDYGYDFKTMINDFLVFIPSDKLTVIFGMYGYDWQVDEKKRPRKQAKALTLNEINSDFVNKCMRESCTLRRDEISKETEINYVNSKVENNFGIIDYHIIWFEDEKSVEIKKKYLEEKGIGSVGWWAYGYF